MKIFSLLLVLTCLMGCSTKEEGNKTIENNRVCMRYDVVLEKCCQYPVVVEGKTYYGCCDESVVDIATDKQYRISFDPVTKKEVDKSNAIVYLPEKSEKVLYFESVENIQKYLQ